LSQPVRYELEGGVARITLDDGKVNAMSLSTLEALHSAFDRAAADDAVVLLTSGRERIFSAGFDLKVFAAGNPEASLAMVRAGAELALKLLGHPAPVVTVCAGDAYPMGAFLILASDVRIGVAGPHRIGFNEVAIGIAVPSFALALGRYRLAPAWLDRTAVMGEMYSFSDAVTAGFLDRLVAPADFEAEVSKSLDHALRIHRGPHAVVKSRLRQPTMKAMREAIDAELTLEAYGGRAAGAEVIASGR
jgi:enoyl-CoA hydratase